MRELVQVVASPPALHPQGHGKMPHPRKWRRTFCTTTAQLPEVRLPAAPLDARLRKTLAFSLVFRLSGVPRAGRPRSRPPPGWAAHLQKVVPSCPSCLFFKIVGIGWSLSEQTPPPKKFSNHWKTHENFSNHWKTRPPPPGCRIVQKPSVSMDIIGFGNGLGVQVACSPMIRQKELFNR